MIPKRRFFAALALLITSMPLAVAQQPPQAGWAGWAVCAITIQGPGYTHSETHLWTITGPGTTQANMAIYPTTWTVNGEGTLDRVSGPTRVSAQWRVNGTLPNVTIGTTLHLNRITVQRWTNHGPARGGLIGTEIRTVNNVGQSRPVVLDVQQWAFPGVETGTTSTRASGSKATQFDGARGPMAPPGSVGVARCEWDFVRGGSPSAPPATPASTGVAASGTP